MYKFCVFAGTTEGRELAEALAGDGWRVALCVATEYGAVCLRGLTVTERAKALISIAHPQFRPWLKEEFQRLYQTH